MSNHAEQAKSLFMSALDKYSPEQWPAFLDGACRDDVALRERVEQLLQAHVEMGSIHTSAQAPTIDHPPLERPGTQIGPYELLQQIGEGGMGVVYMASQSKPVHRQVALKIIKPGMDSKEVVRRFEAERQALAIMDHPNIAKVFDGGATEAGRPYFVMELVQGTQITEFCDQHQLTTRARLELFVTLCHGVQHAHQKGVIHRDLKPSNLLVEVHDSTPVPKIIDFGIAKAMGQQLTGQSLLTHMSQLVGTPLYMSPEQASQNSQDIDTRSDIYSLGVVLYEMLTGTTPFEKDSLRTAGVDEMRRIIREVDPPRPSARVSTLRAADLSTISERRHVEPRKLSQELRGELDWIIMKALEKNRDRRYETANGLAADVERYLHDEPVQACPPSAAYRFTKFARRNQVALVTSALFALMLIVGTGVSVWQAIRATNAELAAITQRDEKEQQTLRATRAELAALAERDANKQLALRATNAEQQTAKALLTAQERLQFGRQAVDEMYTQVAEKWLAQQAELTQVQKQFLEKAVAFYQQLATEDSADPAVLFETAKAEQRVGAIQFKLGQHKEAEAAFRRAIELFAQMAREPQDAAKYNQALAKTRRSLGSLLFLTGRSQAAEQEHRLAFTLCQALAAQFPDDVRYQLDLAKSYDGLGVVLLGNGKTEAKDAFRQGTALFQSLLTRSPDDHDLKYQLAQCQAHLARSWEQEFLTEAENIYRSVASLAAELVVDEPGNPEYRVFQATALRSWGEALPYLGRLPESEAILRQAVTIEEGLVRDFPQVPMHQSSLVDTLGALGISLSRLAKSEESEQVQRRSLEILEKLAAQYPEVPDYRSRIGDALNRIADVLMDRGNWEGARQLLEQALVHQKAALEMDPQQRSYIIDLCRHLENLIAVQLALGDQAAAARTAETCAHHLNANGPCPKNLPTSAVLTSESILEGETLGKMAEQRPELPIRERRQFTGAAHVLLIKAIIQDAIQQSPDDPYLYLIVSFLITAPEPLRDADLALKLARRAVELKPGDPICLQALGDALYRTGDFQGALEAIKQTNPARSTDTFIGAMAFWQLGKKAEAKTAFDADSEWLKGYEHRYEADRKEKGDGYKIPLPVWLKRLQAEAAALLGVTPPAVEPAPAPAEKVEEVQELPKSSPAPEPAKVEEQPK